MARETLANVVADAVRESLRRGEYQCGDRLVELTISQEMNVSQNTARDALAVLEHEGWVVKRVRRGFIAKSFDAGEAEELYSLRVALEKVALAWALEAINDEQRKQLARLISDARLQSEGHELRERLFAFHTLLAQITGRQQTIYLLATLHNQSRLLENLRAVHDPRSPYDYAELLTIYGELVTHIRYGDLAAAQATLEDILIADCRSLLPMLDLVA